MKTLYYLKSIPHLMNQMSINQEEIKNSKPKNSLELQRYQKVHVPGNGNCLFSSLDMIVFDGSFGSYTLRQFIANFNDNKDVYILITLKEISSNTLKKLGRIGWNSRIICILKHDWCLNWVLVWCQRF